MAARFLRTGGGSVVWDASNTAIWSATSGGATGASVPVDGDTVTMDALSGGGTVTLAYDPTVTSIDMGAFTGTFNASTFSPTMDTFNCSGTGARTLSMGTGTWTLRGSNATILEFTTVTNLTINASTSTVNCTYSGSTGTRTLTLPLVTGVHNISISAGSDATNIFTSGGIMSGSLNFTGYTGNFTGTRSFSIGGSLTLGAGMTVGSRAEDFSFISTTSGNTITTNGVLVNKPFNFNGVGGVWTLQDSLNMSGASDRTLTLTNGTFNANNFNVTCSAFSSSNSNVRTLTMGSGTWTLTGSGATIWSIATGTNLTFTNTTASIIATYSGSTGTRTFSSVIAGTVQANISAPRLFITAGTDIVSFNTNSSPSFQSIDFTGFSGSILGPSTVMSIRDNLILSTGMTFSLSGTTNGIQFIGTSTNITLGTFTTNDKTIDCPLTFNGSEGSWQLGSNLTTTNTITFTQGTFNLNNFNVTCTTFASSNSNTRTLTMGSGTWTLTGTGTVWNTATTTNMTTNAGTSTIIVNDASASSKTFASGAMALNNLTLTGGGSGTFIIGNATTISTFNTISVPTPGSNVQIFAGKTLVISALNWSGVEGSLNTFTSTTNGTPWFLIAISSNTVNQDYISLRDSYASGNTSFYAGPNSVNVANNSGWEFFAQPSRGAKIIANANRVDFGIMFNSKTKKFVRVKTPKQRSNFKEQQQPTQGKKRLTSAVKLFKTPQTIITRTKSPAEQMPVVIYPTAMGTESNKE